MDITEKVFRVIVKSNAPQNRVEWYDPEKHIYRVAVKAAAHEGKANSELVKFLSKHLKRQVRIKSGFTSRVKTIEVVG